MSMLRFSCLSILAFVALTMGQSSVGLAAENSGPVVIHAVRHDVSLPMRDIIRNMPAQPANTEQEIKEIPNIFLQPSMSILSKQPDMKYPGIQKQPSSVPAPVVDLSFDAINVISSGCNCMPPDTNGDVGKNEYIQWVNTRWAVYDKTDGSLISGPTDGNSFWSGFGGQCETTNEGDPLVVYDQVAERWVMSQFTTSAPFAQCVAVSTSSDPLGTYNRYEFQWPLFGDYGKLAMWTDDLGSQSAYMLTTHEFSGSFQGAALIAMERDKMLAGDPSPAEVRYPGYDAYGVQPVNLIGTVKAPANACPSFVHFDASTSDYLFWDMCLDWATPANTTITGTGAATRLPADVPFAPLYSAVPQPGTTSALASFGSNVMYRATARAFPLGAPQRVALVIDHVVKAGPDHGGVRWVEFDLGDQNAPAAQPTPLSKRIVDQGVFAPDDDTRWMGAVAVDTSGNIGMGYSVSSTVTHPQIRITGRALTDAPGMMRDEQTCTDGIANGSQTRTSGRWGDYSSMNVDPADQCRFWFTTEYYPTTSVGLWQTRVCSFKFADCGNPDFVLVPTSPTRIEMCTSGSVTDPTYDLRAAVLNGYSSAIDLSIGSAPSGTSATFSVSSVSAPGASELTLNNVAALASGQYTFTVDGFDGAIAHSLPLELGISAELPQQPDLFKPVNSATAVKVRPALYWSTVGASDRIFGNGFDGAELPPIGQPSTANSYTVEVATDSGFSNVVASADVTEQHWTVDVSLNPSTTYYWRVTSHNYCGDSTVSSTFSFTTGVPGTCPAGTSASTVYQDDFTHGVNGWTAGGAGDTGTIGWAQGAPPLGLGFGLTTVWSVPDNDTASDYTLTSPDISIPGGAQAVILSYDEFNNFEANGTTGCWDNGSLALSEDSGASFGYLGPERMFTHPYDGVAENSTALYGKLVWCRPGPAGSSTPTHAVVDLDDYVGKTVKIRFRAASDTNAAAADPNGWVINNFKLQVCQ